LDCISEPQHVKTGRYACDVRLGSGQDTRERIVAAAVELFARQGFHATSVQAIVENARVTKGAFYHHFQAKEDILFEIMEFLQLDFARRAQAVVSAAEHTGESAAQTIGKIVGASVEMNNDFGAYNLVWVSEMRLLQDETLDSARVTALVANAQKNLRLVSDVIRRGIAAGEFRSMPDVGAIAVAISSLPSYYKLLSPYKVIDVAAAGRMWADFFLHGLGGPAVGVADFAGSTQS
jgi:TetR/AcrR family transcriptional regulator, cholesterol catabolism regulator